ncbi:MAG: hypothetical protein K8T26_10440 [Lentisphaerae bacterium]|nr:hypothetical protein [Lentisphaerota bacterium]
MHGLRDWLALHAARFITRAAMCLYLGILIAHAGGDTNTLPAYWGFEEYNDTHILVDANGLGASGWCGEPTSATAEAIARVTATNHPPPPIPFAWSASSANALHVTGLARLAFATNQYQTADRSTLLTNVTIGLTLPARRPDPAPFIVSNEQFAAYFNTNGLLTVRHAVYANAFTELIVRWTELQHPPVPDGVWVRLAITMDYLSAGPDMDQEHAFAVALNEAPLASPWAYTNLPTVDADADVPSTGAPGTTNLWFLCADSGFGGTGPNHPFFASLAFDGNGLLDDVSVTPGPRDRRCPLGTNVWSVTAAGGACIAATPYGIVPVQEGESITVRLDPSPIIPFCEGYFCTLLDVIVDGESKGPVRDYTFSCVAGNHTLTVIDMSGCGGPDGDADGDGATTWEEWLAGTDPLDPHSRFQVLTTRHQGGSNIVIWYGTTNTGVFTDFSMLRTTTLCDRAGWALVATNLVRHPSGTNTWMEPAPPAAPAVYYRPAVPAN